MKKALDGYIDTSPLTNVQKDCLIAIAQANGYEVRINNSKHITLGLYTKWKEGKEFPKTVQTLADCAETYTYTSSPIISIGDFLKNFAPEWSTGVCTNISLDVFWWVDDKDTYQNVGEPSVDKEQDVENWGFLQARRLFSFGESSEASTQNTNTINADKLVTGIITADHYLPRHTPSLESYKDFCKNFGGSVSVNDEYYTYYTDGDDYYEFTSLEEFEGFLRDYEEFFNKYSGNLKR